MFFVAANSSQAAKWFRRNVALRFSSFYFADPQALHAGTWPTQLHSNNLEHLTFCAQSEYWSPWTESPCMCVSAWLPGSFDMQFDLQVGVGTLIVAKLLDAEVQSVYNMTVQVTDGTNFATAQVSTSFICHAATPSHLPCSHKIKSLLLPPRRVHARHRSSLRLLAFLLVIIFCWLRNVLFVTASLGLSVFLLPWLPC